MAFLSKSKRNRPASKRVCAVGVSWENSADVDSLALYLRTSCASIAIKDTVAHGPRTDHWLMSRTAIALD